MDVRKFKYADWNSVICKIPTSNRSVKLREVHMENLSVGETIRVTGCEDISKLRVMTSSNFYTGDPADGEFLKDRRFTQIINEQELTYEVTRQE